MEPNFALIAVDGGYIVETFNPKVHLCVHGWTFPDITLFQDISEVQHLRDEILN